MAARKIRSHNSSSSGSYPCCLIQNFTFESPDIGPISISCTRPTIEAGRGMGMSKRQALWRIELPLAVPVILAGVRTALIINVGMAALAFLIGGGGLGETINAGLKLGRDLVTFTGAATVALVAITVDWLAAVVERILRPKGL